MQTRVLTHSAEGRKGRGRPRSVSACCSTFGLHHGTRSCGIDNVRSEKRQRPRGKQTRGRDVVRQITHWANHRSRRTRRTIGQFGSATTSERTEDSHCHLPSFHPSSRLPSITTGLEIKSISHCQARHRFPLRSLKTLRVS